MKDKILKYLKRLEAEKLRYMERQKRYSEGWQQCRMLVSQLRRIQKHVKRIK